jgi:hypothetical protein
MKWIEKTWITLAVLLAVTLIARASLENPGGGGRSYQSIIERNPFGLKPLPPPVVPGPPTNETGKGTLKLTGFTTLREKRAFFILIDDKTKTNQPISLAVDQEVNGLKVLGIDARSRQVRVMRDGVEKLMSFASDGLTNAVAVAGVPPLPGAQGMSGGGGRPTQTPAPTVTPGVFSPNAPPLPGARSIPSRNLRTSQGAAGNNQPIYAGAGAGFSGNTAAPVPIPISAPSNVPMPAPQADHNFEEQVILMEAQRQLNPNLPPTPGLPSTTLPSFPPPPLPGGQR